MVNLNGRVPQHPGPDTQLSQHLLKKKKAPNPPGSPLPLRGPTHDVSPYQSPTNSPPPSTPGSSPLPQRRNVYMGGPVFKPRIYRKNEPSSYIATLHPPKDNGSEIGGSIAATEDTFLLNSANSSRRPSLNSFLSNVSSRESTLTRKKRRAPAPPGAPATVPELEPIAGPPSPPPPPPPQSPPPPPPPPPPPLPPVLPAPSKWFQQRPPEPPVDYDNDDGPAEPPEVLPPRAMSLPVAVAQRPPKKLPRLLPEPEPDLWDLMKFELSKAVAAREERAPVIKDPERAKYQGARKLSTDLMDDIRSAYTTRERRRSRFVLRMREGGHGLSKLYKARATEGLEIEKVGVIKEEEEGGENDDDTGSSTGSLEMVEWVPADDLDEEFMKEDPDEAITARGNNIPTFFHIFQDQSGGSSPLTQEKHDKRKRPSLKKSVSNMIGNLSKTLGRRTKVKHLIDQGWDIYHSPQSDLAPKGEYNITKIEKRSAYAYHPQKDKLMLIKNYDRVAVTEDGERIRESAIPKEKRPKSLAEETVELTANPKDILEYQRRLERERQQQEMAEREFIAVRQQRRHFSAGDLALPAAPSIERAAEQTYIREKLRISDETKPDSFKKHDQLMAQLEGHAYKLKSIQRRLGKPRKAKSLSRVSFADDHKRRNPLYSSDDEDDKSDDTKSPAPSTRTTSRQSSTTDSSMSVSTPDPEPGPPAQATYPMPLFSMQPMQPMYPMYPPMPYPGYGWGSYPAMPWPTSNVHNMPLMHPGMMHPGMMHPGTMHPGMMPYMGMPTPDVTHSNGTTDDAPKPTVNGDSQTEDASIPPLIPPKEEPASVPPAPPPPPPPPPPPVPSPPTETDSTSPEPEPSPEPSPEPPEPSESPPASHSSLSSPSPASSPCPSPAPVSPTPPGTPSSPRRPGAFLRLSSLPRPWSPHGSDESDDEQRRKQLVLGPPGFRPMNFRPNPNLKPVSLPPKRTSSESQFTTPENASDTTPPQEKKPDEEQPALPNGADVQKDTEASN